MSGKNHGQFEPGRSGNPGGRPSDVEVAAVARRYTPDAIRALVDVCRNAYSQPGARVSAALGLLDRGWGKPKQELDFGGGVGQALHLHLYAVQRLEAARAVTETLEAPPIEAEASAVRAELLPASRDSWPDEALPLWDAAHQADAARQAEADVAGHPAEPDAPPETGHRP